MKKNIVLCEPDLNRKRELLAAFAMEGFMVTPADDVSDILSAIQYGNRPAAVICSLSEWRQFFIGETLLFTEIYGEKALYFLHDEWRNEFAPGKPLSADEVVSFFSKKGLPLFILGEKENELLELKLLEMGVREYFWRKRSAAIIAKRVHYAVGFDAPLSINMLSTLSGKYRLTVKEEAVLSLLLDKPHKPVSRELLAKGVLHKDKDESRCVDTLIKQLRRKLRDSSVEIKTFYGRGYGIVKKA